MTTFVALYRGQTISDAKLIGVSAEQQLVRSVAHALLNEDIPHNDPVLSTVDQGRKNALQLIADNQIQTGETQS